MTPLVVFLFVSLLFVTLLPTKSIAPSVGINNNAPHASAVLDVQSVTKGLLIPRMSTAQRKAIPVSRLVGIK